MSNLVGIVFGIYHYHDERLFRIICNDGREVYLNDSFVPVKVTNDNDLQTVAVRINGVMVDPWSLHHGS